MERQANDRAVAASDVVIRCEAICGSKEFAQQGIDVGDHAAGRPPRHGVRFDVQTPGGDVGHQDLVGDTRWDEDGTIGGNGPRPVAGLDLHHSACAIKQLCPTMLVTGQHITRRVVRSDREHVDGQMVDAIEAKIVHDDTLLANTRKNMTEVRLPAFVEGRLDEIMSLLILFLVGLAVGVTTVLFGFGGGFVTVPIILIVDAARGPDALRIAIATSALVMVVNAVIATSATRRSVLAHLRGRRPLFFLLAFGGAAGAIGALFVPAVVPRWGFVIYVAITVVDLLLRPGFFPGHGTVRPPKTSGRALPDVWGIPVGGVASFLGVGGSVVTVPMMRRSGMDMGVATSLANPLTIAIAAPAMAVAFVFGGGVSSASGLIGTVDVASAFALLAGAIPVIVLVRRRPPTIPAAVHSWAYLALIVIAAVTVAITG